MLYFLLNKMKNDFEFDHLCLVGVCMKYKIKFDFVVYCLFLYNTPTETDIIITL